MKNKTNRSFIPASLCLLFATLWGGSALGQDLPFTSGSTGADGPLTFKLIAQGRWGHAMAFDPVRQQLVLFGGEQSGARLGDTWVWDGTNWTEVVITADRPSRRYLHSMVYDAARQEIVLFGGYGVTNLSSESFLNDTWTWNGTNWNQKISTNTPSVRTRARMVYDAERQKVMLFGGHAGSSGFDQTWTWDGMTWQSNSVASKPQGRFDFAMAYDSARKVTVLFGGRFDNSQGSHNCANDTWVWNGTNWTQLVAANLPTVSPTARWGADMAYDSIRQQIVMFGGYDRTFQTWIWNGTNWNQSTPATSPPGRHDFAMAYDNVRQNIVLFGGNAANDSNAKDTWKWTGTNWEFISGAVQFFDMASRPSGIWNFTSINIPSGVTVSFLKNANNTPLQWLATENVTIAGNLNLNGAAGLNGGGNNQAPGNEASPGPGGFAGGLGGIRFDQSGSHAGTPGQGPGGGNPGVTSSAQGQTATHSTTYGNAYIQPLIGGSGGGGGGAGATFNGGNGGAGGGAILISSSRDLILTGAITANGGSGSTSGNGNFSGAAGSGGAIRLQADRVSGTGTLTATPSGRIRVEGYYRPLAATGSISPVPSVSAPVTNSISAQGSLIIANVAGQVVVQPPGGNTQNPDVIFTSTGPINVTATSTNIPNGTPVILRVTSGGQLIYSTNNLAGGSANFTVTVPAGIGTIQASASFTISN